jgi:hypothetical protein
MKSYREIEVNETLVIVLGYSHFFTAESLDGHLGMSEVYKVDELPLPGASTIIVSCPEYLIAWVKVESD